MSDRLEKAREGHSARLWSTNQDENIERYKSQYSHESYHWLSVGDFVPFEEIESIVDPGDPAYLYVKSHLDNLEEYSTYTLRVRAEEVLSKPLLSIDDIQTLWMMEADIELHLTFNSINEERDRRGY